MLFIHTPSPPNTNIHILTELPNRGLDIPMVDVVINYDVPTTSKDYIHRVGRTARAGRSGKACTFVTQYDVELIQRIEKDLGRTLEPYQIEKEDVLLLQERVSEAQRLAVMEMKEQAAAGKEGKNKRMRSEGNDDDRDRDDDVVQAEKIKFGSKTAEGGKGGRKGKGKSSKKGRF